MGTNILFNHYPNMLESGGRHRDQNPLFASLATPNEKTTRYRTPNHTLEL